VRLGVVGVSTGSNQGPGLPSKPSGWPRTNFGSGQSPAAGRQNKAWIHVASRCCVDPGFSYSTGPLSALVDLYPQIFHQGRFCGSVAAVSAVCIVIASSRSICWSLAANWASCASTRAWSISTRAASSVGCSLCSWLCPLLWPWMGTVTTHLPFTFCPLSIPLANLRRMVFPETPSVSAAPVIEYSMRPRVAECLAHCLIVLHKGSTQVAQVMTA